MPAQPKHRGAIIEAAVALFRRKGYSGTGLADIVERSGAPKGSLYHYFPKGKASIAEAAVAEASRRAAETLRALVDKHDTAGALFTAYAGQMAEWMAKSGFQDGSPITTVLLEMAPKDEAVTRAGREGLAARTAILRERLEADGVPTERASRLAELASAALEGALVQARIAESQAPILNIAEEMSRQFAAATKA